MKNQVIKSLTSEHGEEIIKYWESKGVDIGGFSGCMCEEDGDSHIYYGFINDIFSYYSLSNVEEYNAEIIELPLNMDTNEGRLAYAKKHYPIGTFIKSMHTGNKLKLTSEPRIYLKTTIIANSGDRCPDIYQDGVWATIIKEVEEFDMDTNEGRLAYAKKHYPIGTEIYNHYGEYRKLTSEPRKFGERVIDVGTMNGDGLDGFCTTLYTESKGWVKIIEKEETKVMEKQKLSRAGLKEIHSVACSAWKDQLEAMGYRNPLEDYIELTQEQVDVMFKACTATQLPIVSKYLKQDDGSVDVSKVEYGDHGAFLDGSYIIRHDTFTSIKNGFWLNPNFNWEFKMNGDYQYLIPTKKK
jgi:hypothetical protein